MEPMSGDRRIIPYEEAMEIAYEVDPTLAVTHPTKFSCMVKDIIVAACQPTFSLAKRALTPYGTALLVEVACRYPWVPDPGEALIIRTFMRLYSLRFFERNKDLLAEGSNPQEVSDMMSEFGEAVHKQVQELYEDLG